MSDPVINPEFSPEPNQPQHDFSPPAQVGKVKKGGKGKKFVWFLVTLLLAAGAAYGAYAYQQQQIDKKQAANAALTKQLAAANAENETLKADAEKAADAPTTDEEVLAAVKAYCQAAVDPTTKKALVYTAPTGEKKVLYSVSDKNFATVTAVCGTTADSKDPAKTYYVKLSGETWTVLYGATTADATLTKTYAIPADFK